MTPTDGVRARELLASASAEDQEFVLGFAREAPLVYGPWRHFKALYKAAESAGPPAVLGTLIGRIDRVDPKALTAAASEGLPELTEGSGIAVDPPYACLAQANGFKVLDVSDPTSPRVLARATPGRCRRVLMAGQRAYLEVEGRRGAADGVLIVDLSDPSRPRNVGAVEVRRLRGMALRGTSLLLVEEVGQQNGRLRVLDVSAPDFPVELAVVDLRDASGLALVGSRAYVSIQGGRRVPGGLHVVDLSDPEHPAVLGFWRAPGAPMLVGETLLPGSRQARWLYIVDTEAPLPAASPTQDVAPRESDASPGILQRIGGLFKRVATEIAAEVAGVRGPELPHSLVKLSGQSVDRAVVHGGYAYLMAGLSLEVVSLDADLKSVGIRSVGTPALLAVVDDQLLVFPIWGAPQIFDLSDPARPAQLGVPPSPETLEYMKRRGRRCLRGLSKTSPDTFVETAYHALAQSGEGLSELDLKSQWVSVDLLYGGSDRYCQVRHGRGPYVARWTGTRRRTREERCPAAWDARPDLASELLSRAVVPWQAHETMLKILQANRLELPPITAKHCLQFLSSPSPLLQHVAVRAVAPEVETGKPVAAETSARAFFFAPAALRNRMAPRLQARAGSPNWARPFTAILLDLVTLGLGEGRASRRIVSAAALLNRAFAPFVMADRLLPVAERLLRDGHPELARLALTGFGTVSPAGVGPWLRLWCGVREELREPAWQRLADSLRRTPLTLQDALALVSTGDDALQWTAWHLLRALSPAPELVSGLWNALLDVGEDTPALRAAIASPAAMELLRESGVGLGRLGERLAAVPALGALLSPEALEPLAASLPVASLLALLGSLSDERWPDLRTSLLSGLRASGRLAAFWKAAPGALANPAVEQRLLDDAEMAASFVEVADPSLLDITDPPFEPLLLQWVTRHTGLLTPNSPALLAAATHPLPAVREPGLARVRESQLELPFSLRLLESGVPACMELGRAFFEGAPAGSPEELTALLALCDSPERAVRAIARELIRDRREALAHPGLITALAQHGDPEMNRFLAHLLSAPGGESAPPEPVREFDRGVLRARNRGRQAKEAVKARLSVPNPFGTDTALLLELARSGTPRDAEWALGELARLAADGQAVEGLSLEGVAGV